MQMDVDKLEVWSRENLMEFSKDKCKVLNPVVSNPIEQWSFRATYPESSFTHKDLWVHVENK